MNKVNLPDKAPPFQFSTKGGTLALLAPQVKRATFCQQVIVTTTEWRGQRDRVVAEIIDGFGDGLLAIRSSATHEDGAENSYAGVHLSRTNVDPTPSSIAAAVDEVFESFIQPSQNDQVLVQPMVTGVVISGVVLTRDLDSGSPYYVINYDDFSGRTDTVTGGGVSKAILVHRSRPNALHSPRFRKVIDSVIELERITSSDQLDIEFCIDDEEKIFVLQVRPLAARRQWDSLPDVDFDAVLDNVRTRLAGYFSPKKELAGTTTILGEMPDWNPAEMIGNAPRPLSLSLYKNLITDRVWAEARARMGYRRVDDPLLVDLHGRPFIDVRLSLNSFLPTGLDDDLADRFVNHQIACLGERHDLHDKIEFEIAVTCRDFSFGRSREKLLAAGFNDDDLDTFESALAKVTHSALMVGRGGIENLVAQSNQLLVRQPGKDSQRVINRVRGLLDDCRNLGTLPFSQLARHGFIGVLFLRSLVDREVLSQDDADRFMRGIHTVAGALVNDTYAVATGELDRKTFLERYGHLRPATYDILSWRYDERPDLYLGHTGQKSRSTEVPFEPSAEQHAAIAHLLDEFGYDLTPEAFLAYIVAAIKGREQSKFAFSRAISNALALLSEWGEEAGLSRDDLSFVPLHKIIDTADELDVDNLRDFIQQQRAAYKVTRAIRLPHLITKPTDIDVVGLPLGHPTFITSKTVSAKPVKLSSSDVPEIDGHIVLIESADPGFDWIFSHRITGLITKYGGTNSHMAIRCAEFGLPAAIGCGERLFNSMADASIIELNCAARKLGTH